MNNFKRISAVKDGNVQLHVFMLSFSHDSRIDFSLYFLHRLTTKIMKWIWNIWIWFCALLTIILMQRPHQELKRIFIALRNNLTNIHGSFYDKLLGFIDFGAGYRIITVWSFPIYLLSHPKYLKWDWRTYNWLIANSFLYEIHIVNSCLCIKST